MTLIQTLGRQKQADFCEFKASLLCQVRNPVKEEEEEEEEGEMVVVFEKYGTQPPYSYLLSTEKSPSSAHKVKMQSLADLT